MSKIKFLDIFEAESYSQQGHADECSYLTCTILKEIGNFKIGDKISQIDVTIDISDGFFMILTFPRFERYMVNIDSTRIS